MAALIRLAVLGGFFTTRARAAAIRSVIEALPPGQKVTVDWTGVTGCSEAFADELAGKLAAGRRGVTHTGMGDAVRDTVRDAVETALRRREEAGGVTGINPTFALRVKTLRTRQGLTMRQLAARCDGIVPNTICRAEAGKNTWLANAAAIADGLGVPLSALLEPVKCTTCADSPPPGFTCQECGTAGHGLGREIA